MAKVSKQSANYVDAVKVLQDILATDQNNRDALSQLGELNNLIKDYNRATNVYENSKRWSLVTT